MITIALMLLQAATATGSPPAAPVSPKADWVAKPSIADMGRCMSRLGGARPEAVVTMRCVTAPHDQIKDCVVISNTRAPDSRFEGAALCTTKYFRIRAGAADSPVMDVPVTVPFVFVSPATLEAMVKAARAGRLAPPPDGAVSEVVFTAAYMP
jgi:hypothetical protein